MQSASHDDNIMPCEPDFYSDNNNFEFTKTKIYGVSGTTLLLQKETITRKPFHQWTRRILRYYLVDFSTGICVNVPSPKRFVRRYPGMEDVVRHMLDIAEKRVQKTRVALSA